MARWTSGPLARWTSGPLARRRLLPERMDEEPLEPDDLGRCLRDLERLSAIGLAHRPTLDWVDRMCRGRTRISILDVGSGGGDMLRRIAALARARGVEARLTGLDLNSVARVAAERATDPALGIRWRTGDVFDPGALDPDDPPDLIVSLHFAHHLDEAELPRFLAWMESRARLGWFVNDLHRHPLLHAALRAAGPVLRLHPFVAHDGPVSVGRAFVRADWEEAVAAAGLDRDRLDLRWRAPFRWTLGTRPEVAAGTGPEVAAGTGPEVAAGTGPEIAAGTGPEIAGEAGRTGART